MVQPVMGFGEGYIKGTTPYLDGMILPGATTFLLCVAVFLLFFTTTGYYRCNGNSLSNVFSSDSLKTGMEMGNNAQESFKKVELIRKYKEQGVRMDNNGNPINLNIHQEQRPEGIATDIGEQAQRLQVQREQDEPEF